MRRFALVLVAAFVAAVPFLGSPALPAQAAGADLLSSESELGTAFAPFAPLKVTGLIQASGSDGWDAGQLMQVDGAPGGPLLVSTDAAELPTPEGAAGFLQTKLQQLRDGTKKDNMAGDLGPADANLTGKADEAYFGVFISPPSAPEGVVMGVLISRFGSKVVATTALIKPGPGGTVSTEAQQALGIVMGVLGQAFEAKAAS